MLLGKQKDRREKGLFHCFSLIFLVVVLIAPFPLTGDCWAKDSVRAEYRTSSGKLIELRLQVERPQPSHIIVAQTVPPGNKVVGCVPQAQKIDMNTGAIKWLLKKIQPGSITLKVKLAASVEASSISAVLRYRDPASGKFIEKHISP